MAQLTGYPEAFHADTTAIDSAAEVNLGTRAYDPDGNEYIYLKGVASTAAGDFVTYDENFETTRLSANGVGPVAVAMAATVASKYGWYQIFGKNATANLATGSSADIVIYATSTAGRAGTAVVAGDHIVGAVSRATASDNVGTVQLNYPMVTDKIS